ncbi:MAG: tetratricopeptide repeat-containing glycosyltransferase family protein [Cyanobacteria bacterium P01_C01_bin.89]
MANSEVGAISESTLATSESPVWFDPEWLDGTVPASKEQAEDAQAAADDWMLDWFYTVIETIPNRPWTYQALGLFCHDRDPQIALAAYSQALFRNPNQPDLLMQAAGLAVLQKKTAIAQDFYHQAIGCLPNRPEPFYNLGRMAGNAGENHRAIVLYSQALLRDPNLLPVYFALGDAWGRVGDWQRAYGTYRAAQQPQFPPVPQAAAREGHALNQLGDLAGAIAAYDRAVEMAPASVEHRCSFSLLLLAVGQWQRGWAEYHWRLKQEYFREVVMDCQPLWQGESLAGKTILVRSEQGLGDTIQFCRYLPQLKAAARLIFRGRQCLRELVMTLGCVDLFVDWDESLDGVVYDVGVPLMSLPRFFAPEPAIAQTQTASNSVYLSVPHSAKNFTLPPPTSPTAHTKIGIVWASGHRDLSDLVDQYRQKTCDLTQLMGAIDHPQIQPYSLQVGRDVPTGQPFFDDGQLIDLSKSLTSFSETAAAIAQLDLVISVDTAVAHLAGALGKPVWILLPWLADWRWLRNRPHSVWYTSDRLFRQPAVDDWDTVYQMIHDALYQALGAEQLVTE